MTPQQASAAPEQHEDRKGANAADPQAKQPALPPRFANVQSLLRRGAKRLSRWPLLSWTCVSAALIGCQALVTSGLTQPRITVMLPYGPGDELLRQQFLRGFTVGEDTVKACSITPPSYIWLGLAANTSPSKALSEAIEQQLVVAPPSADLRAFSRLAKTRNLSVLLPFQRGASLDRLATLEGNERLWPLVPSRKDDLKAIADASLNRGWDWVMVVRDPDSLESSEAETFVELFFDAGGGIKSYTNNDIQSVAAQDEAGFKRFSEDMLWSRVPTMVVAADPNGPLATKLRDAQSRAEFGLERPEVPNWVWISGSTMLNDVKQQPWQQLGLQHPARGDGWTAFSKAFESRWGKTPTLLEASGYDTARVLALAGTAPPPQSKEGTAEAMGWVDPEAEPVSLCEAFQRRQQGKSLRIPAAASDFRLKPAEAPSGSAAAGLIRG